MAAFNADGYAHNFLEQSSTLKEFECPLCLLVTKEPSLTSCCGQHFCWYCISRITINRKPCPFCKTKTFTVFQDKKQKRKVLELKVSCTMKERGCTWTGELGDLAAHTDWNNGGCQYVDVICSNKCGKKLQRQYLHAHKALCPNRHVKCLYCNYQDTYVNIQNKHYPKCPKYPIHCPNECGIVNVRRILMFKHLNECPKRFVKCEFAYAGCAISIHRQDLKKHAEQSMQSHLSMVSSKLQESDQEMRLLMTRLDEKNEQVMALDTRVYAQEEEVRVLKTRLHEKDMEVRKLSTALCSQTGRRRLDWRRKTRKCGSSRLDWMRKMRKCGGS